MLSMVEGRTTFLSSVLFKVMLVCMSLAAFTFASELTVDALQETRQNYKIREEEACSIAEVLAREMETRFRNMGQMQKEVMLATAFHANSVKSIGLIDRNGTYKLDGDITTPPAVPDEADQLLLQVIETSKAKIVTGENSIKVAVPLFDKGVLVAAISVESEAPTYMTVFWTIFKQKAITTLPLFLAGIIFAAYMAMRLTRPLRRLEAAAIDFANGDLNRRVEISGRDEIQRVGKAFNFMASALQGNIEEIHELAYVDRLTSLPNRVAFTKELNRTMKISVRRQNNGALLFIDLDGFKEVNDTYGHEIGDMVLAEFARRLTMVLRPDVSIFHGSRQEEGHFRGKDLENWKAELNGKGEDTVDQRDFFARLGGDEFVVILPKLGDVIDAARISNRILDAVKEPFQIDGNEARIGASIGIATFPEECQDIDTLIRHADHAMYEAKARGKDCYFFHSRPLNEKAREVLGHDALLQEVWDSGEIQLFYQPRFAVGQHKVCALEATVGWTRDGQRQFLTTCKAKRSKALIQKIDTWAVKEVCREISRSGLGEYEGLVSLSISGGCFSQPNFALGLISYLHRYGIEKGQLELQLEEETVFSDKPEVINNLKLLSRSGIVLAVRGFGITYTHLERLEELAVKRICISPSYANRADVGGMPTEMVFKTVLAVSSTLGIELVVDGISSKSVLERIKNENVSAIQGPMLCEPLAKEELREWLANAEADQRDIGAVPATIAS